MGVSDISDIEIEAFKKRRKRILILTGIAAVSIAAGLTATSVYACERWNEIRKEAIEVIEQENIEQENRRMAEEAAKKEAEKRESIEQIVAEALTPDDAYLMIETAITFSPTYDYKFAGMDKWSSLEETYFAGIGDCEDGAIAFAAMLSDNPEYEVRVVYLKRSAASPYEDHMIAVYKDKQLGTWGYASFNENVDAGIVSVMENPLFGSIDKAIREYNDGSFAAYQLLEFTAEELKFGTDLTGKFNSSKAISLI